MKPPIVSALATVMLIGSLQGAAAGLLISGGTGGQSATSEASSPFPLNLTGSVGGSLYAQDSGVYSFTYMGLGNPGFINTFSVSGCGSTFTGYATPIGTSFSCTFAANTLIPFVFDANTTGAAKTVGNGQAYSNGLGYLVAMTNSTNTGVSAFIGLSDGGSSTDHDYQDLVVQVNEIPEPGALLLLAAGLLGLGLARGRGLVGG